MRIAELLNTETRLLCSEPGESLRSGIVLSSQRLLGFPQRVLGSGPERTLFGGRLHSSFGSGHGRARVLRRLPGIAVVGRRCPGSHQQQPAGEASNKHSLHDARL
jgi:hypothetical protein